MGADPRALTARLRRRLAEAGLEMPVRLWDGTELGPTERDYRVVLRRPWSLRSALLPPNDLTAGEAYLYDDIEVEGSMVAALRDVAAGRGQLSGLGLRALLLADLLRLPPPPKRGALARAGLRGRLHSRDRDRVAVRFHYDVGNDFYRLFLDRQLVYSCAYFAEGDDDLDRAQTRKLELICRKLRLRPDERLLDIGCGWGALVIHAARHHGVRAIGVTLSEEQAALGKERAHEHGVSDRVEIRVADYREVRGSFDAVASVGMVEHVGADQLANYFTTCYRLTAPGGRFLNHGITTGRRDVVRDMSKVQGSFIAAYVFPDGALVPAYTAVRHLQQTGFDLHDLEQLRPHYARTLQHWTRRLEANAEEAHRLVGDRTYRVWRAYMAGSAIGFESGDLGVVQILGSRGAQLPLGRAWMLPD